MTAYDAYHARGFVLLAEVPDHTDLCGDALEALVLAVNWQDVRLSKVVIRLPRLGCSIVAYVSWEASLRDGIGAEVGEAWLAFMTRTLTSAGQAAG